MSNKRWDNSDKLQLMKLYSEGHSYEDIGKTLARSPSAIKLRLESIVYDNLVKGKDVNLLTRMLNTNSDTIKQLYYSHKSFKEGRGEAVTNVEFPPDVPQIPTRNIMPMPMSPIMPNNFNGGGNIMMRNNDQKHRIVPNKDKNNNNSNNSFNGNNTDIDIESIKQENHVLEGIINNYRMKRQVRKLYIEGKLDEKSISMYEKLVKPSK